MSTTVPCICCKTEQPAGIFRDGDFLCANCLAATQISAVATDGCKHTKAATLADYLRQTHQTAIPTSIVFDAFVYNLFGEFFDSIKTAMSSEQEKAQKIQQEQEEAKAAQERFSESMKALKKFCLASEIKVDADAKTVIAVAEDENLHSLVLRMVTEGKKAGFKKIILRAERTDIYGEKVVSVDLPRFAELERIALVAGLASVAQLDLTRLDEGQRGYISMLGGTCTVTLSPNLKTSTLTKYTDKFATVTCELELH